MARLEAMGAGMGDLKKRRELGRMALKVDDNACIEEGHNLVQNGEVRNSQRTLLDNGGHKW